MYVDTGSRINIDWVAQMVEFEFEVPCTYHYVIKARSEKEARKILVEKGGIDIQGRLCLEEDNYRKATVIK